jgi:hypothetical protein
MQIEALVLGGEAPETMTNLFWARAEAQHSLSHRLDARTA